jgi:hypothetical protein
MTGDGPGKDIAERVPLIALASEGTSAVFAVALEPVPEGTQTQVRSLTYMRNGAGLCVTVQRSDGSDVIIVDSSKVVVQRGGVDVVQVAIARE